MELVRFEFGDKLADAAAHTMKLAPWLKTPLSATGHRAGVRADRERIAQIKAKREKIAAE